jgi:hypothetical protein
MKMNTGEMLRKAAWFRNIGTFGTLFPPIQGFWNVFADITNATNGDE